MSVVYNFTVSASVRKSWQWHCSKK